MNNEIINFTLQFLERVQLQGSEVPAFNQVMQSLILLREANEKMQNTDEKKKDVNAV